MKKVYAPGCALMIYKPELAGKVMDFLQAEEGEVSEHLTCCQHEPGFLEHTQVVNTCAGCDKRYRGSYKQSSTISLWEIIAQSRSFEFPDYQGMEMSIQDACPTRSEERVHIAIRELLRRMNIKVVEPEHSKTRALCCGDSFYGLLPIDELKSQMQKRAQQMSCENVVVYCVSCIKSMHIGGKKPRYILDLLFGEATEIGTFEPDEWHGELRKFIESH